MEIRSDEPRDSSLRVEFGQSYARLSAEPEEPASQSESFDDNSLRKLLVFERKNARLWPKFASSQNAGGC